MPAVSRPYYGSDILQTNNTHHYSNHALAFPKKLHSLLSGTLDLTTNLNWMLLRGRSMPEVSRMNFMSDIRVFPGKRDAASRAFSASEGAASGFAHSIEERSLRRSVASVLCKRYKSVLCDEASRVYFASDTRAFFATKRRECTLRAMQECSLRRTTASALYELWRTLIVVDIGMPYRTISRECELNAFVLFRNNSIDRSFIIQSTMVGFYVLYLYFYCALCVLFLFFIFYPATTNAILIADSPTLWYNPPAD
jgi:hypothetical protein